MRVRLWKLGSLDHRIAASPRAFDRLREVLQGIKPDDPLTDIIWDPAISVCEIEINPEGINVATGPDGISDELRDKIQKLIEDELFPKQEP